MKKEFLYMFFLLLLSNESIAQSTPIYYTITNEVCKTIDNYITQTNKESGQYYYAIWHTNNDTTSVLIVKGSQSKGKVGRLIESSNRFVKIRQDLILPVILKTDLLFSENLNVIENRDKPNESITTTTVTSSGFLIVFSGKYSNMKIINAGYFQS